MEWFLKKRRYNKGRSIPFDVVISTESNPALMSVMYNAGLAAHANYMTLRECLAITEGSAKKNALQRADKSAVTSFEEFQYFTGLTTYTNVTNSSYTNSGSGHLTALILPSTLTYYSGSMICDTTLELFDTNNLTTLGDLVFHYTTINNFRLRSSCLTVGYCNYVSSPPTTIIKNLFVNGRAYLRHSTIRRTETITSRTGTWSFPEVSENIYLDDVLVDGILAIRASRDGHSSDNLTDIKFCDNVFRGYKKITELQLLKYSNAYRFDITIGKHSFDDSGLTKILIDDSFLNLNLVASFGESCFKNTSITEVILNSANNDTACNIFTKFTFEDKYANPLNNGGILKFKPYSTYSEAHNFYSSSDRNLNSYAFYGSGHTSLQFTKVVNIGESAFEDNKNLILVYFNSNDFASGAPRSLTGNIGNKAFYGCTSLTTVEPICNSIGNYAFFNCKSLSSPIPNNGTVTSIGDAAFMGCTNLTTVDLTAVTSIYVWAFRNSHIQTLIANDLAGVGGSGTHTGIFRDAVIDKADLRSGTWSDMGLSTIKKAWLSGTISVNQPQVFKNTSLLILERDLNISAIHGYSNYVNINVSTPIIICKCSYTVFDTIKLATGTADWVSSDFSTSTCVVADGVDKTNFTTYGFASVQTVTEYNTEHGTTYTDIDALATALWEDTNLD